MIQRIQTLWMALTAILVGAGVFAGIIGAAVRKIDVWFMAMVLSPVIAATALVPLVAIFLYKNRKRQISLLIAEFVLLVGALGFAGYYSWWEHRMWAFAPMFVFGAIVTNWLALRGVMKDEILVRSAGRVR